MECGVCIGGGDYESPQFYDHYIVKKSRKAHTCYECRRTIAIGSSYEYTAGKWDGRMEVYKTCLDCMNIRSGLSCEESTTFGELWSDIYEVFEDLKSTACLTKIPTASAKAYFLDRWRQWKGLNDA